MLLDGKRRSPPSNMMHCIPPWPSCAIVRANSSPSSRNTTPRKEVGNRSSSPNHVLSISITICHSFAGCCWSRLTCVYIHWAPWETACALGLSCHRLFFLPTISVSHKYDGRAREEPSVQHMSPQRGHFFRFGVALFTGA